MSIIYRIYRFYRDGFRDMTVGRTLWLIILVKLFIMFAILKIFFFPSVMSRFDTPEQKSGHILEQLGERWTQTTTNQARTLSGGDRRTQSRNVRTYPDAPGIYL